MRALTESLTLTTMNIPLVAKFQAPISKKFTFFADAGIIINLSQSISYENTGVSADYEAVYKFLRDPDNTAVYDDAPVHDPTDWQITKSLYANVPGSNTQALFDTLWQRGHNVRLNVTAANKKGTVNYKAGSVGFLLRPSVGFQCSNALAITVGGYLMSLTTKNTPTQSYRVLDFDGKYDSPLNAATTITSIGYGVQVGLRYSFGG
jgi:hypothetical protein